jgi:hypothetical protein
MENFARRKGKARREAREKGCEVFQVCCCRIDTSGAGAQRLRQRKSFTWLVNSQPTKSDKQQGGAAKLNITSQSCNAPKSLSMT